MYKLKLVIDNYERWANNLFYEYFYPLKPDEEFYRKFLYKNFPYKFSDAYDLFPYNERSIPSIKPTELDKKLQEESLNNASSPFRNGFTSYIRMRTQAPDENVIRERYYNELALARHKEGLDYGMAPNYTYNYDKYIRPGQNMRASTEYNLVGGIFHLEFNSSNRDEFLYEWMLSGSMKQGKMVYCNEYNDPVFKIEFWDCYCIGVGERMTSDWNVPMKLYLRLSPAITRNRGAEHQKVWKKTDITPSGLNFASQGLINMPTEEPIKEQKLLVKKLEGPFFENGKLAEEMIEGNTYIFKATEYTDSPKDKVANTKWAEELNADGTITNLNSEKPYLDKGVVCYKYKARKAETIRLYAYVENADKKVSVEVPVVSFPMVIARSVRRAGKCYGTNGKELTREDITNLNIKYPEQKDLLKQKLDKGYENLGIEYDKEKPKEVADYKETKASIIKDALEYIEEYNKHSDEKLFDIMQNDLDDWATGDLDDNLIDMINFFKSNNNTANRYEDKRLTNAIAEHTRTKDFISGFTPLLERELNNHAFTLNQLKVENTQNEFIEKEYDPKERGNPEILGIVGLQELKSLKYDNRFSGFGITVDGTQAYNIILTEFSISNGVYQGKFILEIFDHFGLDSADILKDEKYIRHQEEFICWYMLQHLRGYKPFITYIPLHYAFNGSLNKNNLNIELNEDI